MSHTNPVANVQDLIDRLKHLTRPIDGAEYMDIAETWNELEDLFVMIVSSKVSLDLQRKAATLDTVIAAIDDFRKTETRNANSDEEPGRVDQHRGSRDGDGSGNEGRTGSTGHRGSKTD